MTSGRLAAKVALGICEAGGANRLYYQKILLPQMQKQFERLAPSVGQRGPCQAWTLSMISESVFFSGSSLLLNTSQLATSGCKDFLGLDLDV